MKKVFWSFLEIFETVAIAVIAVVLIRSFIAQPFLVSGSSMEPSFHSGNYLLVDEFTYNFREPQRGEVVVFRSPSEENDAFFIKRIIGMPSERVEVSDGKVTVYDEGESRVLSEDYVTNFASSNKDFDVTLDENEYFVMGDNRGFSFDSRSWGPLDEDRIVGLVRLRLWPVSQAMAIEAPSY